MSDCQIGVQIQIELSELSQYACFMVSVNVFCLSEIARRSLQYMCIIVNRPITQTFLCIMQRLLKVVKMLKLR